MGRPPVENPRTKVQPVRLTPDEHAAITTAAASAGIKPGVWMRQALLEAAERVTR